MDPVMAKAIDSVLPKFNPLTAEGLAVSEMKKMEAFIDEAFRTAAQTFPPGLKYEGYHRCSPTEEYKVTTAKRFSRHVFELAECSTYMCAYHFSLDGVEFKQPRYLLLPYVHRGGIIHLRGVKQHISPVLADIGISVESDNIFIWLSKTKLIIKRTAHTFIATHPDSTTKDPKRDISIPMSVAYSDVHHLNDATKARRLPAATRNKAVSTLIHYVLCKYGVTETFKRFCNADVIIGGVELTEEQYPADDWVICRSTSYKPRGTRNGTYQGSDLRIVIPKSQADRRAMNIMGAIFYTVDHFPDRLRAEYLDSTRAWRIQLGHAIFKSDEGEGILQDYIESHLSSIEGYMDSTSLRVLASADIHVNDTYELFMDITDNIHERLLSTDPASMYGKRLSVLSYVAYDITIEINRMAYKLHSSKKPKLSEDEIKMIMNKTIKMDTILGLSSGNGFTEVVSSPGDCMVFKITNQVIAQTDATGSRVKSRMTGVNPANFLHASVIEVGSFGNLSKASPNGKNKLSPYVLTDDYGLIQRSDKHRVLLDSIQDDIKR